MTTFGDQLFQFGGTPVGMTGVPQTFGDTWFVDPDANGAGTGKTMRNAFTTVGAAVTASTNNNHDVILMNGISAHSTASDNTELTMTNSRTHFVGLCGGSRYFGQRTRWTMGVTTGTAIAIVQNTGVGNTFTNIKFDSSDTLATSIFAFAEGGEYTQMTNCEIREAGDLGNTSAANLLCNGDSAFYKNCMIGSLDDTVSVKRPLVLLNRETISGKVARDVVFEDCLFFIKTSSSDASAIHGDGANDIERILLLKNCDFVNALLSSATPDQAVEFDSTPTQGNVLADNCSSVGFAAFSTTTEVFSATAIKNATGPEAIQSS